MILKVSQLTDQTALAKVAVEDKDAMVREVAVEKLTDQKLLASVAVEDKDATVRRAAAEKLTDQTVLAKVAVEDKDAMGREVAVEKLTDATLLAKVAVEDKDSTVRRAAEANLKVSQLAGKNGLVQAAIDDKDSAVRQAALKKLTDPVTSARMAILFGNREEATLQRSIALLGISHDGLMAALARKEPDITVRTTAILLTTNQLELKRLAMEEPMALVREAAVVGVVDDDFLRRRAREETSAAVRLAVVRGLQSPEAIYRAANEDYYLAVREAAQQRLNKINRQNIFTTQLKIEEQAAAVASAAETSLVETAIHGKFDVVCRAAAQRLADNGNLKRVMLESTDREVVKIALGKLTHAAELEEIANHAGSVDQAVRLAAAQKAGLKSWDDIFRAAINPKALGDAVAAVSLFETVQSDAKAAVEQESLAMIRRGDESRIPEMADLLEGYGNKDLAEDYLNCGQPDLNKAGRDWAFKRGYEIDAGNGSNRAAWGSGK